MVRNLHRFPRKKNKGKKNSLTTMPAKVTHQERGKTIGWACAKPISAIAGKMRKKTPEFPEKQTQSLRTERRRVYDADLQKQGGNGRRIFLRTVYAPYIRTPCYCVPRNFVYIWRRKFPGGYSQIFKRENT